MKAGGLLKLEQLFDNSETDSDVAVISPCFGLLRIGNTKGFNSYVIEPKSKGRLPIVYHLYEEHLNTKVDKDVNTMEMLLSGDFQIMPSIMDFIVLLNILLKEFNKFMDKMG